MPEKPSDNSENAASEDADKELEKRLEGARLLLEDRINEWCKGDDEELEVIVDVLQKGLADITLIQFNLIQKLHDPMVDFDILLLALLFKVTPGLSKKQIDKLRELNTFAVLNGEKIEGDLWDKFREKAKDE